MWQKGTRNNIYTSCLCDDTTRTYLLKQNLFPGFTGYYHKTRLSSTKQHNVRISPGLKLIVRTPLVYNLKRTLNVTSSFGVALIPKFTQIDSTKSSYK